MCAYTCEVCGRNFNRKSNLDRHLQTHQSKRKKFVCSACSKMYANEANLKAHFADIHAALTMSTPKTAIVSNKSNELFEIVVRNMNWFCHLFENCTDVTVEMVDKATQTDVQDSVFSSKIQGTLSSGMKWKKNVIVRFANSLNWNCFEIVISLYAADFEWTSIADWTRFANLPCEFSWRCNVIDSTTQWVETPSL